MINDNNGFAKDLNNMDYKEFEKLCKDDFNRPSILKVSGIRQDLPSTFKLNVYAQFRYIVNFFIKRRNQQNSYFINTKNSFVDDDLVSSFNGFNVYPSESFREVNRFIVFINPEDPEDSYSTEVELNIPSSKEPTHVCILSEDNFVIDECFRKLKSINPNLRLVNITNEFNISNELTNKVLKKLSNFSKVCLADYCKELSSNFHSLNDYSFFKRFDEIVDEILSNSHGKICYFGGEYMTNQETIYSLLVVECFLRDNNFKFYIEPEKSYDIALRVSSCLLDYRNQLVEDVVAFMENFPKICVELRGGSVLTNFIDKCELTLKLRYLPLNVLDKNLVKINKIKSNQIRVIKVSSLFNIESNDLESNIEQEKKLKSLIMDLYNVLELNSGVIDLTNLVFFELGGVINVGYLEGYEVSVYAKTHCPGLPVINRTLNDFDSLNKFMYLPVFANGSVYIKNLSNKLNFNFNLSYGKVYNSVRRNASLLKHVDVMYSKEFLDVPNILFTIGMSNKSNIVFRNTIRKGLIDITDLNNVRSKVDSFGCFNKITNNTLEI